MTRCSCGRHVIPDPEKVVGVQPDQYDKPYAILHNSCLCGTTACIPWASASPVFIQAAREKEHENRRNYRREIEMMLSEDLLARLRTAGL